MLHYIMHVCTYVRMYICMYVCIYKCMYVHTYEHTYVCIYVYIAPKTIGACMYRFVHENMNPGWIITVITYLVIGDVRSV